MSESRAMSSDSPVLTPAAEDLTELIHRGSAAPGPPSGSLTAHASEDEGAAPRAQIEDFEKYVARRHRALLRTAYLLTGDSHTAEDLVQTALARAWLAWPRIREPAGVDAYVRRILVNTQRSSWRRKRVRVRELLAGTVPERAVGIGATSDLHQVLWACLADLPRQQRATLVLRYYEDLSNSEIADVLGVSTGTVKSNASRALATLRQRATAPSDMSCSTCDLAADPT